MQIQGARILVMGGWGLVGGAICHKLMLHDPAELIISSLRQSEAEDAVNMLRNEYPDKNPNMFVPKWGNIFSRIDKKDEHWENVLSNEKSRKEAISDILDELNQGVLDNSTLYQLISEAKPDIMIDCINTATAIAYKDIYHTTQDVRTEIDNGSASNETIERMLTSLYLPQLIRHVQLLFRGIYDSATKFYVKVGTSGTGGMGFNIPYTHSEERPSRPLLAKAAVAGAQSLLLFLKARTPDGPIVKEIKPTAAIAWKKIAYGKVMRGGRPIPMFDLSPDNAKPTDGKFDFSDLSNIEATGKDYESIYIDTGENGIFSKGEFKAIGSLGQMEIVTPEEIADCVVFEILGGNSGHDIVQGLDSFSLGPSYRGGMLYNSAIKKLEEIEKEFDQDSIAFEMLGPPRLSKLLFEANLLKRICGNMKSVLTMSENEISDKAQEIVKTNNQLRAEMLSIGLVVLLKDGKSYLRGKDVKIPLKDDKRGHELNESNINSWCYEGWVDLRPTSFIEWKDRLTKIISQAEAVPSDDTSSRYTFTKDYWENFSTIDEGKIAGWIFEFEDKGWRFKR